MIFHSTSSGELFKVGIIHESTIHQQIIQSLLERRSTWTIPELQQNIECLCTLLQSIGQVLDSSEAKVWYQILFIWVCKPKLHAYVYIDAYVHEGFCYHVFFPLYNSGLDGQVLPAHDQSFTGPWPSSAKPVRSEGHC